MRVFGLVFLLVRKIAGSLVKGFIRRLGLFDGEMLVGKGWQGVDYLENCQEIPFLTWIVGKQIFFLN